MPEPAGRVLVTWLSAGTVDAAATDSLVGLFSDPTSCGHLAGHYSYVSGPNIALARNEIARRFLSMGAGWLLTVDSDMSFTPGHLVQLLQDAEEGDHPILGAAYCAFVPSTGDRHLEASRHVGGVLTAIGLEQVDRLGGVQLVDCVGAGLCLIRRDVFERMDGVWLEPLPFYAPDVHGGQLLGEDWTFCLRAAEVGIPSAIDMNVRVGHVKRLPLGLPAATLTAG